MLRPALLARTGHSAIVSDQKQVALWRAAQEAVTVGILAEEGGVVVVEMRAVQRLSRHDPCPRGAEHAARETSNTGTHAPPTFAMGRKRAVRADASALDEVATAN